jgi:ATP-binding cassette subfamily F protein uup
VKKLSFNEQRELEELPLQIQKLEAEQEQLDAALREPDFYRESPGAIERTLARLEELKGSLVHAYTRWDELESRSRT